MDPILLVHLNNETISKLIEDRLQSTEFQLLKFNIEDMPVKVGFLGDNKILEVCYFHETQTKSFRFFVKLLPSEPGQRDMCLKLEGFKRELIVYTKLFRQIQDTNISILNHIIPKCFMGIENEILVFEFLNDFKMRDKHELFDFNHVNVLFKSLAKLHAASVLFEQKCKCRIGDVFNDIFYEFVYEIPEFINGIFDGIEFTIETFFPDHGISQLRTKLKRIQLDFVALTKRSSKYPNVLLHGDLYSTNAMFSYDRNGVPRECKIVDYQMARYLPQAFDVMSTLFFTTSRSFRDQFQVTILKNYFESFNEEFDNGDKVISYEEFLQSCEEFYFLALFQRAAYFQLIMMPKVVEDQYRLRVDMQKRFLSGDRSQVIEMSWRASTIYAELMGETHVEIIEYLKNIF